MTKREFGELELAILTILKAGGKMTVKEVRSKLGGKDKYNTIMTVMARLAEKNVLYREKMGLQYEYWLQPSPSKAPSLVEFFKKKLFGIKTTEVMSYLLSSAENISDEEFAEMEQMIAKAKKEKK